MKTGEPNNVKAVLEIFNEILTVYEVDHRYKWQANKIMFKQIHILFKMYSLKWSKSDLNECISEQNDKMIKKRKWYKKVGLLKRIKENPILEITKNDKKTWKCLASNYSTSCNNGFLIYAFYFSVEK